MMDGRWGGNFDGGTSVLGGILMMALWVAVIIGIVVLIIWLVRQTGGASSGHVHWEHPDHIPGTGGSALEILRNRYANGEIDRAEFEEKKKDLSA